LRFCKHIFILLVVLVLSVSCFGNDLQLSKSGFVGDSVRVDKYKIKTILRDTNYVFKLGYENVTTEKYSYNDVALKTYYLGKYWMLGTNNLWSESSGIKTLSADVRLKYKMISLGVIEKYDFEKWAIKPVFGINYLKETTFFIFPMKFELQNDYYIKYNVSEVNILLKINTIAINSVLQLFEMGTLLNMYLGYTFESYYDDKINYKDNLTFRLEW